jgi:bisphosphoglycerate-independent phosphoglycerate mutase (AlkP superfamily)
MHNRISPWFLLPALAIALSCSSDSDPQGNAQTTDVTPTADVLESEMPDAVADTTEVTRGPLWWLEEAPTENAAPHLLFIGLDGVRGDAFEAANTPTFDALRERGTWTFAGTTQLTTRTDSSAGWTALVAGVDSTFTGVLDNDTIGMRDFAYPSFAQTLVNSVQAQVVIAAHWLPFAYGVHEGGLTDAVTIGSDEEVTAALVSAIQTGTEDVYLLHLDDIDAAGHFLGFSVDVPEYIAAIETADAYAGRVIAAVGERATLEQESWLVMVVTDHGGEGTGHGDMVPGCQIIPFVFAGANRPRGEFDVQVSQFDVAPTVLTHFGALDAASDELQGVAR